MIPELHKIFLVCWLAHYINHITCALEFWHLSRSSLVPLFSSLSSPGSAPISVSSRSPTYGVESAADSIRQLDFYLSKSSPSSNIDSFFQLFEHKWSFNNYFIVCICEFYHICESSQFWKSAIFDVFFFLDFLPKCSFQLDANIGVLILLAATKFCITINFLKIFSEL